MKNSAFVSMSKNKIYRALAAYLAVSILAQVAAPTAAMALTSGPSQPEVQSFEPVGTSDMVEVFSGDFNYNIPLFELPGPNGGYPFNIAYHSGIGMDQEASWVGLGWNLNAGAITREMRGFPDDFSNETIRKKVDMRDMHTYGMGVAGNRELAGADFGKLGPVSTSLQLGFTVYHNNYRGIGYSLSPGIGFTHKKSGAGLGIDFSADSQEGVGVNASLSITDTDDAGNALKESLGIGFNSKKGIQLSYSGSIQQTESPKFGTIRMGGSSSFSFAEKAFTPAVRQETVSGNLLISGKYGWDVGTLSRSVAVSGFYSIERLKHKGNFTSHNAYGYNYLYAADEKDLTDFSREKDGMIRKNTPNLAIPQLTYDYYNVMGQGIAGMFRGYRNDIGTIHDPTTKSRGAGGSVAVEYSAGASVNHIGFSRHMNYSMSESKKWSNDNGFDGYYNFIHKDEHENADFENLYFKMRGEQTSFSESEMDHIGGEDAVKPRLQITGDAGGLIYKPEAGKLIDDDGDEYATSATRPDKARAARNTSIQLITNNQLLMSNGDELLKEYDLWYYTEPVNAGSTTAQTAPLTRLSRSGEAIKGTQTAAVTALNADGARYIYGLPVYNLKQYEVTFTCAPPSDPAKKFGPEIDLTSDTQPDYKLANTEQYYSRTEIPAYAHSYLLTAILGADYVDVDNNGPSDADHGYWVKFNYVKTADRYKWRAPFTGANYDRGLLTTEEDDKASYIYGEKEVWHLASAVTKTHIAYFHISPRPDGRDAGYEINGNSNNIGSNYSYQLDEIALYSRAQANPRLGVDILTPIKKVHFEYDNSLCPGVENAAATGTGKLTLKRLYFTYQNSTRGELNPYTFEYKTGDGNPGYSPSSYDRWGNYKHSGTAAERMLFPYVRQFNPGVDQTSANKAAFKAWIDEDASVWHLKKIKLPTGGEINVEYESDDYAYVQHKQAMQMIKIERLDFPDDPSCVYRTTPGQEPKDKEPINLRSYRKVYFTLEHPVPVGAGSTLIMDEYLSSLRQPDGKYQLYFKLKSELRTDPENLQEFVSGYCTLKLDDLSKDIGYDDASNIQINNTTYHTKAYITLAAPTYHSGLENYHPFALAAWQHLRTNQPSLFTTVGDVKVPAGSDAPSAKATKAKSLLSIFPEMVELFRDYNVYARNRHWADHIDLANSYIRLQSPDKIKYGGGSRVKKLTINDKWDAMAAGEQGGTYGMVYDYTMTEPWQDGERVISSGVAQYEPLIGGDEIPLRHAKPFVDEIPVKTDNSLFIEYPLNESHYPGPHVGYRKITVQSLASEKVGKNLLLPEVTTTGLTEYEFYTAKEFPVITEETEITKKPFNLYIPLPFVGQIQQQDMTAAQGYVIKLNDMHGKPKSVSYYARAKHDGAKINTPVSSVKYYYSQGIKVLDDGSHVYELNNLLQVLKSDKHVNGQLKADIGDAYIGEEYDFFTDQRHSKSKAVNGGLDFNIELTPSAPLPFPWPTLGHFSQDVRTFVTNKVIHKTGILLKTVATDGESTVTTENKLFDSQTGRPLLSTVTNDFNEPIYKYDQPAFWAYDGMGAAYKNEGLTFRATTSEYDNSAMTFNISGYKKVYTETLIGASSLMNILSEGDEFIIGDGTLKGKATLVKKLRLAEGYELTFHSPEVLTNQKELSFVLVRSGRRNLLSVNAGSITALDDPTLSTIRGVRNLAVENIDNARHVSEIANFLNSILCEGRLPIGKKYVLDELFNTEGEFLMPELRKRFRTFEILPCVYTCGGGICSSDNNSLIEGYHINFVDQNGVKGTCHCIARSKYRSHVSHPFFLTNISDISATNGVLEVEYTNHNPTTWAPDNTTCGAGCFNAHTITPSNTYTTNVLSASAVEFKNYWGAGIDNLCTYTEEANPYLLGTKGTWRPWKDHYYRDQRRQDKSAAVSLNLKRDGVYAGDNANQRFYFFNWHPTLIYPQPVEWVPNSTITKYNENGFEVENKDILGLFSSALYGYNSTLNTAVASNARRSELVFLNADDPYGVDAGQLSPGNGTSGDIAHTGKKSIKISSATGNIIEIPGVKLTAHKKYILSFWVARTGAPAFTYLDPNGTGSPGIKVHYVGSSSGFTNHVVYQPAGRVIEKWQRAEVEITGPLTTQSIKLELIPGSGYTTYFDDIRIYPKDGNMKTFVYDPLTYRLAAALDENNYASIYSYDEQGNLFLVKKETVNGIKTIQESRSHQVKQP